MSDLKKIVKKRLIDLNKTQRWLIEEVKNKTGLYFDESYLKRIYDGKLHPGKIISAMSEILEIDLENTTEGKV